jgi:hypothetical protein
MKHWSGVRIDVFHIQMSMNIRMAVPVRVCSLLGYWELKAELIFMNGSYIDVKSLVLIGLKRSSPRKVGPKKLFVC